MNDRIEDLVSTKEAAAIIGRSVETLRYYVYRGRLNVRYQGPGEKGAYFFLRGDVEALAEELSR